MKSSSRFLLDFGIAVAILVVVTVVLVLTTRSNVASFQENTPEGVVQRFLQAIQDSDYQRAYSYLHVEENGILLSYQNWLLSVNRPPSVPRLSWRATMGKTTVTGDTATLGVIVDTLQPQGPFENPVRSQTVSFDLGKIGGTWRITSRPPIYWIY